MAMTYCYIRVSTDNQDYLRQVNILKEKGYIPNENCIFLEEKRSGKSIKREVLNDLINNKIKSGDTIVATELSRISRSVKDFNDLIDEIIHKRKVNLIMLKENFHLLANGQMDAMTKLILNITSSFAEFERDIISDRTKESLRAKKIYGTRTGRPVGKPKGKHSTRENFIETLRLKVNGASYKQATNKTLMPVATFRLWLDKYKKETDIYNNAKILELLEKGKL